VLSLSQPTADLVRVFVVMTGSPSDSVRPRSTCWLYFGTKRPPVQIRPPRPCNSRSTILALSSVARRPTRCPILGAAWEPILPDALQVGAESVTITAWHTQGATTALDCSIAAMTASTDRVNRIHAASVEEAFAATGEALWWITEPFHPSVSRA
jgi:hypothetical protein